MHEQSMNHISIKNRPRCYANSFTEHTNKGMNIIPPITRYDNHANRQHNFCSVFWRDYRSANTSIIHARYIQLVFAVE